MSYRLKVENYGKIEKAEIEVLPLTLFVGDNNSGKSYLLSLVWALFSGTQDHTVFLGIEKVLLEKYLDFFNSLLEFVKDFELNEKKEFFIDKNLILCVLNDLLEKNKDELVKNIFNYDGMQIGKIEISAEFTEKIVLNRNDFENTRMLIEAKDEAGDWKSGFSFPKDEKFASFVAAQIVRAAAKRILENHKKTNATYYLPAARTGFMLAKNTINQVGRKQTFDVVEIKQHEEEEQMSPFPKTIIHFLDSMDNLNMQKEEKYSELVKWIIEYMSKGDVQCVDENSGNVQYVPQGMDQGIPLRATSGVVTELTPLMLLLKYSKVMECICYEEPEMCLHPQLQLQMARLLVQMVNKGIHVVATTHSDIIVQHINNVCQLGAIRERDFLERLELVESDLIDVERVAVYQFKDSEAKTVVERILPQENMFEIPTFMSALEKILEQTINASNVVNAEED